MNKKLLITAFIISVICISIPICFADNPIVQTVYAPDPAPMVYNDTCYVYTGHDEDELIDDFFTMNEWLCFSSKDMVNWTHHGVLFDYTTFSWAQGEAWAAQCIYRNNKFYFYGTAVKTGGSRSIGVAVSDSPTGPFSDPLGQPLIDLFGWDDIDPTVFIDDDGQAYLYWGNPNLYYVRLNQDMISYSGSAVQVSSKPSNYQEGPWLYKRNGLYYLVFPTTCCPESIGYATSNNATGPWNYRDIIMPAQGASFTNHPGICDFAGNSYFFYHNGALPGGGGYHRSVCVEQFSYNSDGTIPSMNMTTTGASQVGSLDPYNTVQAETICRESGIETEVCSEGGLNIGFIENGDWVMVKGVDFGTGAAFFEARVASEAGGGNIEIRLDSESGTLVGTCPVPVTGGWQTWETSSCTVSGASGKHDVYLRFTGGSDYLFNVNWWKFSGGGNTTPEPTASPGDVNSDNTIDIVDALLIAQAYVGLDPANYNPAYADTNCNGTVDIVDALLTAQYYVGLIGGFC